MSNKQQKNKMFFKNVHILGTLIVIAASLIASNNANARLTELEINDHKNDHDEELFSLNAPTWSVKFADHLLNITMKETRVVHFNISFIDASWGNNFDLLVRAKDDSLLRIENVQFEKDDRSTAPGSAATSWHGNFSVEALFLGRTEIFVILQTPNLQAEHSAEVLNVIVLRYEGIMDLIFVFVVGSFVMLLYVNFGAALELDALKGILLRPVGPAIGLAGQFVVMPLLGYIIGYFLFHDDIELRLGLFFTGSAPAGGVSNIFTVILNGNLNLSITMTAISNLAAFIMMPFWIFTLGASIFRDGAIPIPYKKIAMMSCSLVLPLCLGIAMQKFAPKIAQKLAKLLKPLSLVLIIVITIFAFTVNSFMFKLFTWKIIIACSALPWFGYIIGWFMGALFGQSQRDSLTIAIETGIQNAGIAIFMLLLTLPQPQADMTSAVPVATSMMTPLPLLGMYLLKKCFCRTSIEETDEAPNKEAKKIEIEQIMEEGQTNPAVAMTDKL